MPDAIIHASIRMLVETKTERNGLNEPQLRRHLKRLDEAKEQSQFLLVLTPDDERPKIIDEIKDQRMAWTSFALLDQAIDEMLADPHEVVSEREEFLLRELQNFFEEENLLASPNDVVIVAARQAWPEYEEFKAMSANRTDRSSKSVAWASIARTASIRWSPRSWTSSMMSKSSPQVQRRTWQARRLSG